MHAASKGLRMRTNTSKENDSLCAISPFFFLSWVAADAAREERRGGLLWICDRIRGEGWGQGETVPTVAIGGVVTQAMRDHPFYLLWIRWCVVSVVIAHLLWHPLSFSVLSKFDTCSEGSIISSLFLGRMVSNYSAHPYTVRVEQLPDWRWAHRLVDREKKKGARSSFAPIFRMSFHLYLFTIHLVPQRTEGIPSCRIEHWQ